MKKEDLVMKGINAFSRGSLIGMVICLIFNFAYHTDNFYIGSSELMIQYGTNLSILIMLIFSGMISLVASLSSIIYENENRTLLQNTVIHYVLQQIILVLFSLFFNLKNGYFVLLLISTIIYAIIWFLIYFSTKKKIKTMNEKLKKRN